MIKKLIIPLLICSCTLLHAQTFKTDVLVIGDGASAVSAALQCANSKVKTILAANEIKLTDDNAGDKMQIINPGNDMLTGTWATFNKQVKNFYKNTPGYDTAQSAVLQLTPNDGAAILKTMTDSVKDLTIYLNTPFTGIKKDADRWEVSLRQNGKTIYIKARVVIDATENGELAIKAGTKTIQVYDNTKVNENPNSYRTAIVTGAALPKQHNNEVKTSPANYPPYPAYSIPISAIILPDVENILVTEKILPAVTNVEYLPLQLNLGQGAGTIAAYCAFFKTTTKNLKVRIIQGELLDFKGYLLPFTDVSLHDTYWRAVQQVCATGLLKGRQQESGNGTRFVFMADSLVTTPEIKTTLMETYTRAFLWFGKEKPGEKFTVGNTLSLISDYTLTDPETLRISMQKSWKSGYKFKQGFDLNRQITRLEFAVLINKFLNPFARTVDLNGRLVN